MDLLKRIGQQTPNNLPKAETSIPNAKSWSCLGLCVPLTTDEHQGRGDCSFKDSQENPRGEKGVVVAGSRGACSCDSPQDNVCPEPFGRRDFLKNDSYRSPIRYAERNLQLRRAPLGISAIRYAMKKDVAVLENSSP